MEPEEKKLINEVCEHFKENKKRSFLGVSIRDGIYIMSIVAFLGGFYWRTDDVIQRLTETQVYLVKFARNSDGYHSAILGTQFEQGKPVNVNFDVRSIRDTHDNKKMINPEAIL